VQELLDVEWDDAEAWFDWAAKSLSKWKDLRSLTLSSTYFLGPFYGRKKTVDPLLFSRFLQAMPQSLEEITLLGCLPDMLWSPLCHLLDDKQGSSYKLTDLVAQFENLEERHEPWMLHGWKQRWEKFGVLDLSRGREKIRAECETNHMEIRFRIVP